MRQTAEPVSLSARTSRVAGHGQFDLRLSQLQSPLNKSLKILGTSEDQTWWSSELKQYEEVGLACESAVFTNDPWLREHQEEAALREAMGLPPAAKRTTKDSKYIVVQNDSPRAQHWARLHAL